MEILSVELTHEGIRMTICIASVCEKKYVIVAADRMITVTLPNIEYEQTTPKITQITNNCVAATAGSALAYTPIFREARAEIEKASVTDIGQIVDHTKNAYIKMRNKKVDEQILASIGLNLASFYQMNQALQPSIAQALLQNISKFNYALWILIGGVDDNGGHIFRMENPGRYECFDVIGFHAIGSGEHHAISTFIANDFESNIDLKHGLAITFEAKKRSEKATGVGPQTDICIVQKDKVTQLPQAMIVELEKTYQEKIKSEKKSRADVDALINALDLNSLLGKKI
jgi:20S proteasome alpha/beta subunit